MNISKDQLIELAAKHKTPLYVYDKQHLKDRAKELKSLQFPNGLTVRYAMKANNHPEIIKLFNSAGLEFDASSSYEAAKLIKYGIEGKKISLSSQQPAHNLQDLLENGVKYVATSINQLEIFTDVPHPVRKVGLRVNPGIGSGHNNRLTTGGVNSSFGLWHEYLDRALRIAHDSNIVIDRLQIHIGTGADPNIWGKIMDIALAIVEKMPDVTSLDIGGGYKVAYYEGESEADMQKIADVVTSKLLAFSNKTGRKLNLEIEPGRWLVAKSACLISKIVDIVDTGEEGHAFLRVDTGMNDFMRPSFYGAQHKVEVLNDLSETEDYLVVGHNCETGDIFTPAPNDPESLRARTLNRARLDDFVAIYDTGAYGTTFSARGYNDFPSAKEIFV